VTSNSATLVDIAFCPRSRRTRIYDQIAYIIPRDGAPVGTFTPAAQLGTYCRSGKLPFFCGEGSWRESSATSSLPIGLYPPNHHVRLVGYDVLHP